MSRCGLAPAAGTVGGMFTLTVFLPKNRWLPGIARLQAPDGARLLGDMPCRGKADNARAAKAHNADRDPTRPWGDTPSGTYRPSSMTRFRSSHRTLGPLAILIEGETGDALAAKQKGRTGLAVHGGRGDDKLMATYGCVRMFDRDMLALSEAIGSDPVQVIVIDVDDTNDVA